VNIIWIGQTKIRCDINTEVTINPELNMLATQNLFHFNFVLFDYSSEYYLDRPNENKMRHKYRSYNQSWVKYACNTKFISLYFKPLYDARPHSLLWTDPQDARGKNNNTCVPNRLHDRQIFTKDTQFTNIRASQYQEDRRSQFGIQSFNASHWFIGIVSFQYRSSATTIKTQARTHTRRRMFLVQNIKKDRQYKYTVTMRRDLTTVVVERQGILHIVRVFL